jgi:hypothetical protein
MLDFGEDEEKPEVVEEVRIRTEEEEKKRKERKEEKEKKREAKREKKEKKKLKEAPEHKPRVDFDELPAKI